MLNWLVRLIISRFKYAKKADLINDILDGFQPEDLDKIITVLDGRLTPHISDYTNDGNNYQILPVNLMTKGLPVVVQDNKLIGYKSFIMEFKENEWVVKAIINDQEVILEDDDHTNTYVIM